MNSQCPGGERARADGADSAPHVHADECDLVMKGGITSGVVYPLAIVEIAKAFRLRSIGGTSAGAIAAAAAAAAELGRQRFAAGELTVDPKGFEALAGLPGDLCAPAPSGRATRLLALFKPRRQLRKLFGVFTDTLSVQGALARAFAAAGALARRNKLLTATVFVLGLTPLLALPLALWSLPTAIWLSLVAICVALGVVVLRAVLVLLRELPKNGFGVCSGMPEPDDRYPDEALTVWLSAYIDRLSGQADATGGTDRPLTFGDLRRHRIDLKMVSTALTLGRPFRLPFGEDDDVRESSRFLFRRDEFEALFPKAVVDWMVAHAREPKGKGFFRGTDMRGYHGLPAQDDFPVIVAVRMSLSFPVLLSAVPLYSLDKEAQDDEDREAALAGTGAGVPLRTPEKCWFTDGGVGSNFPIHFFDSPLPTRPTFGLDLGVAPRGASEDVAARVVFPQDNRDASMSPWWRFDERRGIGSLLSFLMRIVNVAKDWNHEALSCLPGFRDRIGLVLLTEEEGGLNLTMDKDRIDRLSRYGQAVGIEFVRRFGAPAFWPPEAQPSRMGWDNHQLVRLRLLLASTTELMLQLEQSLTAMEGGEAAYARFFERPEFERSYAFRGLGNLTADPESGLFASQAGLAKWFLDELRSIALRMDGSIRGDLPKSRFIDPRHRAPRPRPELKTRPRI